MAGCDLNWVQRQLTCQVCSSWSREQAPPITTPTWLSDIQRSRFLWTSSAIFLRLANGLGRILFLQLMWPLSLWCLTARRSRSTRCLSSQTTQTCRKPLKKFKQTTSRSKERNCWSAGQLRLLVRQADWRNDWCINQNWLNEVVVQLLVIAKSLAVVCGLRQKERNESPRPVWVAFANRTDFAFFCSLGRIREPDELVCFVCVCMYVCVFYKMYKSSTLRGFVFGVVLCVELFEQHNTMNVFSLYLLGRVVFIIVYGSRYAYMVACIHIWQHICIDASMYTNMLAYMHSSEPTGGAKWEKPNDTYLPPLELYEQQALVHTSTLRHWMCFSWKSQSVFFAYNQNNNERISK